MHVSPRPRAGTHDGDGLSRHLHLDPGALDGATAGCDDGAIINHEVRPVRASERSGGVVDLHRHADALRGQEGTGVIEGEATKVNPKRPSSVRPHVPWVVLTTMFGAP